MTSPTSRALQHCDKKLGWQVAITERYNSFTRRRSDAYGFGDLLACGVDIGVVLIQVTSMANLASRRTKIETECQAEAMKWIACGGKIEAWGWGKRKVKRGGKAVRWTLTRHRAFVGASGGIGWEIVEEQA